jgi:hypothetical protein
MGERRLEVILTFLFLINVIKYWLQVYKVWMERKWEVNRYMQMCNDGKKVDLIQSHYVLNKIEIVTWD